MPAYDREYLTLVDTLERAGENAEFLKSSKIASIVINGNKVLGLNKIEGIEISPRPTSDGVEITLKVLEGYKIPEPVHICLGLTAKKGRQTIRSKFLIGKNSALKIIAHCIFPNPEGVEHIMDADIVLEENAHLIYEETHIHGKTGGILVKPTTKIDAGNGSRFFTTFRVVEGRVGRLDILLEAHLKDRAVLDVLTQIYGKEDDEIKIKDVVILEGTESRGMVKSRIVVKDRATSTVIGEAIGIGENSRGHIDCMEIVRGRNARASAIPLIEVKNDTSKLTHEAAIGSIDRSKLETLMARGLTEDEAVDFVVKGLLS